MTRRMLFLLAADTAKVPTDDAALNSFADRYNTYVALLHKGVLDLRAWRRVREAWENLIG